MSASGQKWKNIKLKEETLSGKKISVYKSTYHSLEFCFPFIICMVRLPNLFDMICSKQIRVGKGHRHVIPLATKLMRQIFLASN